MTGPDVKSQIGAAKKKRVHKRKHYSKQGNYWDLADEVFSRINDSNRQSYVSFMEENEYIARRKGINTAGINI